MEVEIIYGFDNIQIEATGRTPFVKLNKDKGHIELSGKSIPENAVQFYWHFNQWITEYITKPHTETTVNLAFTYLNSASIVAISRLLKQLNALMTVETTFSINWIYEIGDEEMKELGEFLCQDMPFKINFKEVERI